MSIDESLAKRNHDNYSMSDYKAGSATNEYNEMIQEAEKQVEAAKIKVSESGKIKLDDLLNWYKAALANWINKHNAAGANHVSSFISGPSNYNMNKHNKWLKKEGQLWEEYNNINNISSRISTIIAGDNIIKSDDPAALEKLRDKLEKEIKEHENYIEANKAARKNNEAAPPFAAYVLSNSNQRIKNIKDRIKNLEKQKAAAAANPQKELFENNGIKIVDNLEANRLQIVFNYKPDADIRNILKKNGFRWSPTNGAWQRYRGYEAEKIANEIVNKIINI